MDRKDNPFNYTVRHDIALDIARLRARAYQQRQRVQLVTWEPPKAAGVCRFYIAPTAAPAPERIGAEPCS